MSPCKIFIFIGIFSVTVDGLFLDTKLFGLTNWILRLQHVPRQSPINIEINDATTVTHFQPIRITNVHLPPVAIRVRHEGNTVKYTPYYSSPERHPILLGGPLKGRFILDHIHFHWGAGDDHGSEHTMDQNRYAMEMHVVFHDMQYSTVAEAMNEENGLTVLGFLFQVDEEASQQVFTHVLRAVAAPESTVTLSRENVFSLGELIGTNGWDFASYPGSLTTPPYSDTVTWLVNLYPQNILPEDLNEFRQLLNADGSPLVNNYREIQPLYSRQVKIYREGS